MANDLDLAATLERLARGETATERRAAATALIDAGERGVNLSPARAGLAAALGDDEVSVVKEAIWALYVVAWQGAPLGEARAALEAAAQVPALHGNATLGLVLDDLGQGKAEEWLGRMTADEEATTQFGIAQALTDFAERTKDRALAEQILWKIPFGIVAPMLGNGVASSIIGTLKRSGESFVARVCGALAEGCGDDMVKSAPLYGVMQRVNERMK